MLPVENWAVCINQDINLKLRAIFRTSPDLDHETLNRLKRAQTPIENACSKSEIPRKRRKSKKCSSGSAAAAAAEIYDAITHTRLKAAAAATGGFRQEQLPSAASKRTPHAWNDRDGQMSNFEIHNFQLMTTKKLPYFGAKRELERFIKFRTISVFWPKKLRNKPKQLAGSMHP